MGFSALRFGAAVGTRGQVHSVEMDPTVARLAQQVLRHAGLEQVVTVHVGHSEESPRGVKVGLGVVMLAVFQINFPEFGHGWCGF